MSEVESTQTLLLVDDEPVILELLRTIFQDTDYVLHCCADGEAALAVMETHEIDVLLTDKNLPGVGGLELVQHLKQLRPDSEAIVLTGYASLDTALRAMELNVFDYILKPPKDVFEIKRKVHQAFEKQRVVRENTRLLVELKEKNETLERTLHELRQLQQEIIQSEKLAGIGTLAVGVAHEISSPLFGVMGLAEAIQDEEDREKVVQYAQDIVEYSEHIKSIVVDLTGYSRSAESEYLTTVDLSATVDDAVRLVNRAMSLRYAQIVTSVGDDVYVNARTSELKQVLVNLIKNAVESVEECERAGTVTVAAWMDDEAVHITVADEGAGIPEGQGDVLFDPFFTTKAPGKGTGLGLISCIVSSPNTEERFRAPTSARVVRCLRCVFLETEARNEALDSVVHSDDVSGIRAVGCHWCSCDTNLGTTGSGTEQKSSCANSTKDLK